MKRIKNEVNPKSFVSNFWGAPQNILHSIILIMNKPTIPTIIMLAIMLSIVSSCKKDSMLLLPVKEVSLNSKNNQTITGIETDIEVAGARSIYAYDGMLFVETNNPKAQLEAFSIHNNQPIASLCMKGRARNEFNRACSYCKQFIQEGGKSYLFMGDESSLDIKMLDITSSISQQTTVVRDVLQSPLLSRSLGYSVFISPEDGWFCHHLFRQYKNPDAPDIIEEKPYYAISNNNDEIIIPTFSEAVDLPQELFQGKMRIKPDRKKAAFAFIAMPYLFIYDLENAKGKAIHENEKNTFDSPETDELGNDLEMFALDVCTTDKYIILLCPDSRISQYYGPESCYPLLRVFDWSGQYIQAITLDKKVHEIAYDEKTGYLYGLDMMTEKIYQYNLSSLFKN